MESFGEKMVHFDIKSSILHKNACKILASDVINWDLQPEPFGVNDGSHNHGSKVFCSEFQRIMLGVFFSSVNFRLIN